MIAHLLVQSGVITRRVASGRDAVGAVIYTDAIETVSCLVQPSSGAETVPGEVVRTGTAMLFLDGDKAPLGLSDSIEVGGVKWKPTGLTVQHVNPRTNAVSHVEQNVEQVAPEGQAL